MNKKLKILEIIVQNKLRSGGAIQMYLLSRELVKRGHDVCAVYNLNGCIKDDFDIFDNSGIDLRLIKMNRLKLSIKSLLSIIELRKLIQENNFDIIHAHKGNAVDLSICATLGINIPIVTNRGVNIPLGFFQSLKYKTNKIKKIIAVSKAVKEVMAESGRINPDKIKVVFGSVDINSFNPGIYSTLRKELHIPELTKVIGFVGNPNPRKGLKYLIQAFEKICSRHLDTLLFLVGISEKDLAPFHIDQSLRERIYPLGFRKDIPNCMGAFDIYVFPGIRDEGLTGTLREAAAMGLPVITTDVAGNNELVFNGYNGIVVPIENTIELTDAISFLLTNSNIANLYGTRARRFVENNMSNEIRAEIIENIYYNVLNSV